MSKKQINNNFNPQGKPYAPRKHLTPQKKTSITPPDKNFSPPLRMKS